MVLAIKNKKKKLPHIKAAQLNILVSRNLYKIKKNICLKNYKTDTYSKKNNKGYYYNQSVPLKTPCFNYNNI